MNSQPNDPQQLTLWSDLDQTDEPATSSPNIQRDASDEAFIEKPALDETQTLIDQLIDVSCIEAAWSRTKANRGAPGPDGVSIAEFPEWFRPRWETIRQQLLDGMYQPQPARRVTIEKPDGGTRELGSRVATDHLFQTCSTV